MQIKGKLKRNSININSVSSSNEKQENNDPNPIVIPSNYGNINHNQQNQQQQNSYRKSNGPSQGYDKSVLNKIPTVPTKSNNNKNDRGGSGKRDCVIF